MTDFECLTRAALEGNDRTRHLAGLQRIPVGDTAAAKALSWMRQGMDFADGLHLAKAEGCEAFISFDRDFVKTANALGGIKARVP